MPDLQFHLFNCLSDSFCVLVHDPVSGATAAIDAPDAAPVEQVLAETGWHLSHIFVTHHHYDHIDGIGPLKARYNCQVVANKADVARIGTVDQAVVTGGTFDFAGHPVKVIDTPGHTVGQVAFHFSDDDVVFAGDTLFSLGCGRVFEGTMDQMWASLDTLRTLPGETRVYCGHEYTQGNGRFALTVDPDNADLKERCREVDALRAEGRPTLPTTIARERATNPFLRPEDAAIRACLDMATASSLAVFTELRRRKDSF